MARLLLFIRLILRPLRSEPLRTALSILAVALGVAVVIAIQLAGTAAAGSFRASLESLSGEGDIEITSIGGVDERLLGLLTTLPYPIRVSPRIEDFAIVDETGETIPLIGLDFVAEASRTDAPLAQMPEHRTNTNVVLLDRQTASRHPDRVQLTINDRSDSYTVAAPMEVPDRLAVMDIETAQRVTGKQGRLGRIYVALPHGASVDDWTNRLRPHLPASVTIAPRGAQTEENRKMLAAFRWNLTILSYIAVVVGAFLIYNNISVTVVRRRAEIGIVRALGATQAMILSAFLLEATLLGTVGAAVGLLLGRLLAIGAVQLLGATVEALYVSSRPAPIALTISDSLLGLAVGIGVTLLAALAPAQEASRVAPVEAMARGRQEYSARLHIWRDAAIAFALTATAVMLSLLPPIGAKPLAGYAAAASLVGAGAFAIPLAVSMANRGLQATVARTLGIEGTLALRSLVASLARTSVLIGALSTAVAMIVSVGIMVGSFRETVILWLDSQLAADFYLRPAGTAAADRQPTMRPELADKLARLPQVAAVDRFRLYPIRVDGLPANLGAGQTEIVRDHAHVSFLPGQNREAILQALPTGDNIIVSEPFANKHHVAAGQTVTLPLGNQHRPFRILGVYYDYASERGYVVMDRQILLKYLPDPAVNSLAVYFKPGTTLEQGRELIESVTRGHRVLLFDHRTLRREALRVFDRTFAITYALELVAIAVAIMGVAGALLALVIDRRREFGLLRFLGSSSHQVRKLILAEAGILGLLANGIGFVLGAGLSLILIYVINKQSFGWTIQFHWPIGLLTAGLTLIFLTTVVAALYPARTAVALNPIEVIHEE